MTGRTTNRSSGRRTWIGHQAIAPLLAVVAMFVVAGRAAAQGAEVSGFYEGTAHGFEPGSDEPDIFDAQLDVDQNGDVVAMELKALNPRPDIPFLDVVVLGDSTFTAITFDDQAVTGVFAGNLVTLTICFDEPACAGRIEFTGTRSPHGACCFGDHCEFDSEESCISNGGVFLGDLTSCLGPGACTAPTNEIHWVIPDIGDYSAANNWNPQVVPISNAAANPPRHDIAVFDIAGDYIVNFSGSQTSERALVRNGEVLWDDPMYTLKSPSPVLPSLAVGAGGKLVIITAPLVSFVDAEIGDLAGAESRLEAWDSTLTGSGAFFIGLAGPGGVKLDGKCVFETQTLEVGFGQPGKLEVLAGSEVVCGGARVGVNGTMLESAIVIDGASPNGQASVLKSTMELIVGSDGPGRMEIKNGALAQAKTVTIGEFPGTSGMTLITGDLAEPSAKSRLKVSTDLLVGKEGHGELRLTGNAMARVDGATTVGGAAGTLGSILLEDHAEMTQGLFTKLLTVGDHGEGLLTIRSGSVLDSLSCYIGFESDGDGKVLVKDGPGDAAAWVINGSLDIGLLGGKGHLEIDGAAVHVTGNLSIQSNSTGTIAITPTGVLKVDGEGHINANGKLIGAGLYDCHFTLVKNGGLVSTTLNVTGAVQQARLKAAPSPKPEAGKTVTQKDAAADGIGTLTIDGDIEFRDGSTLRIDVAGAGEGQFGVLKVTGNATLGGTLEVHLLNGFVPESGQTIPILQVDGVTTGNFAEIKFAGSSENFGADASFRDGRLEVSTPLGMDTLPQGCGAGFCGVGVVPFFPLTLAAITGLHLINRRRLPSAPRRCARFRW